MHFKWLAGFHGAVPIISRPLVLLNLVRPGLEVEELVVL